MTAWLRLAAASAWNRRGTLGLTVIAITLSVAMLLGVERLRGAARESFALSVSGTDLVVGARTGPVQLMLYAVFRIGDATSNMGWASYQAVADMPQVAWAVPLSLGDSHKGFPVLGTTTAYFEHFRYGFDRPLVMTQGRPFSGSLDGVFEAVLGSEAARTLGYRLGQTVTLSHGSGAVMLPEHKDKPFRVVGILAPTGTPVDRTVHVSLQAIEAIHLDWQAGVPMPGFAIPPELVRKFDLTPREVTAVLVGLHNRGAVFRVQRSINAYRQEPLVAVLPGVALDQLWQVVGIAERAMLAITGMSRACRVGRLGGCPSCKHQRAAARARNPALRGRRAMASGRPAHAREHARHRGGHRAWSASSRSGRSTCRPLAAVHLRTHLCGAARLGP